MLCATSTGGTMTFRANRKSWRIVAALPSLALVLTGCGPDRVASPQGATPTGAALFAKGGDPTGSVGRNLAIAIAPAGAQPGVAFSTQPSVAFHSWNGALLPVGESVSATLNGPGGT